MPPSLLPLPIARDRPVGRYAPSPTGRLHLGNLRTALAAWQAIRERGGIFILRIEDIDEPRTAPGAEAQMLDDLRWLGLDWDEGPDIGGPAGVYRQSERGAIYAAALAKLEADGRTYPCTCSRRDLREASAPHPLADGGEGPPYPGTCRTADPAAQRAHPNGAAVRFIVDGHSHILFKDAAAGMQHYNLRNLCGDFIVRRRDGLWAYQLACAVDDALMGVTHVLRGEDLLSSAPRQIAVMRALGLTEPQYEHIGLVAGADGERMCKRDGPESLEAWRAAGMPPEEARARLLALPTMKKMSD
jgi:glutamyl-tRNA synthetase